MELGELEQIIRPDGEAFVFGTGVGKAVTKIGGRGMPPVDYQTMRGYMQQWDTVVGWSIQSRLIAIEIAWESTTREAYWTARRTLNDYIRPNLGGDLRLRHTRADGSQREVKARIDSAVFEDDLDWDTMLETLTFVCHNPVFYDPTDETITKTAAAQSELAFPITFPIQFGDDTLMVAEFDVAYTGEFPAWPRIDITGPYDWIKLTNLTTKKAIKLGQPVAAGQSRHLDLTPGARYIIDGDGVNRFSDLVLPDSDLLGFNLRPSGVPVGDDPYEGVSGGTNRLRIDAAGFTVGTTQVVITYNTHYMSVA